MRDPIGSKIFDPNLIESDSNRIKKNNKIMWPDYTLD
jgi:hypothetical protein